MPPPDHKLEALWKFEFHFHCRWLSFTPTPRHSVFFPPADFKSLILDLVSARESVELGGFCWSNPQLAFKHPQHAHKQAHFFPVRDFLPLVCGLGCSANCTDKFS